MWAQTDMLEVPSEYQETLFFYCEDEQLKCSMVFFLGYVQKLAGCGSGQPALG